MNPAGFRKHVIIPALDALESVLPGANSKAAVNLLLLTALAESGLRKLKQVKGPALGVYQIEPSTHKDLWDNWLVQDKYSDARKLIQRSCDDALIYNLRYATQIARCKYYRKPGAIPNARDVPGFAAYWKRHYNTASGAGTVEHFIRAANRAPNL